MRLKNDIILLSLPSNRILGLLPLEKYSFGSSKKFCNQKGLLFLDQTSHDRITKARFVRIFYAVCDKTMKHATVKCGFKGSCNIAIKPAMNYRGII